MYQFIDQPVEWLNPGTRLVLMAMRSWVMAVRRQTCPPRQLAAEFGPLGAIAIVGDIHRLMLILHHHGQREMPFGAPDADSVNETEALMLALWADIGSDRSDVARAALALLVCEPAIAPMMASITRCSVVLTALGLPPSSPAPIMIR